jgi:hypothetical protein
MVSYNQSSFICFLKEGLDGSSNWNGDGDRVGGSGWGSSFFIFFFFAK